MGLLLGSLLGLPANRTFDTLLLGTMCGAIVGTSLGEIEGAIEGAIIGRIT